MNNVRGSVTARTAYGEFTTKSHLVDAAMSDYLPASPKMLREVLTAITRESPFFFHSDWANVGTVTSLLILIAHHKEYAVEVAS
jgi:hypothetical protein